ncbi:MAG TPA: hypothetical protein VN715_17075 [Roseiarcus sp.]|nr:hypothetical protein [Roseiarcus sp.]
MKALAVFAICFVAASPAFAMPRAAPHPGPMPHVAPHPGRGMIGGHRHHGHHAGANGFFDASGPEVLPALPDADAEEPEVTVLPPTIVQLSPGPYCPPAAPVGMRHTGPRIIYIGHQPAGNNGPTVIYGTD